MSSMASSSGGNQIKVNVAMITYNHEPFIAQAIDSVLMQETDFGVELVIGEDCSTDATRPIVVDYAQRYPERIRLILQEQNVGAQANFLSVLKACQGQYFATLEGDDFWISPQKLQMQVDMLDKNPDWSICAHRILAFSEDQAEPRYLYPRFDPKPVSTLDDLARGPIVGTSSAVWRRIPVEQYPDWTSKVDICDYSYSLFYAQHGKVGFIDEVMSAYRMHEDGVWSHRDSLAKKKAVAHDKRFIAHHMKWRYRRSLEAQAAQALRQVAKMHLASGEVAEARRVLLGIVPMAYCLPELPWRRFARTYLRAFFPWLLPDRGEDNKGTEAVRAAKHIRCGED